MKNPNGNDTMIIGVNGEMLAVRGYGDAVELLTIFAAIHLRAKRAAETGEQMGDEVLEMTRLLCEKMDAAALTAEEAQVLASRAGGLN